MTTEDDLGVLAITHYARLLDELRPDVVHVLMGGRVVQTGGPELAAAARGDRATRGWRPRSASRRRSRVRPRPGDPFADPARVLLELGQASGRIRVDLSPDDASSTRRLAKAGTEDEAVDRTVARGRRDADEVAGRAPMTRSPVRAPASGRRQRAGRGAPGRGR